MAGNVQQSPGEIRINAMAFNYSLANQPQESHMKCIGVIVLSVLVVISVMARRSRCWKVADLIP